MFGRKHSSYEFDSKTLEYKEVAESRAFIYARRALMLLSLLGTFALYFYIYTEVLGFRTPKYAMIEKNYEEWKSRLDMLQKRLDILNDQVSALENRDNTVYRAILGMDEIPASVREAGFGGIDRFAYMEGMDFSGSTTRALKQANILLKKSSILSNSLDEVLDVSRHSGDMVRSIPTIPPVDLRNVRFASHFGSRYDPIIKSLVRAHTGIDLAGNMGEPIYSSADGVVETVEHSRSGYGNQVVVNHGFGYKTRYAHLRTTTVAPGQRLTRGDQVGTLGNTGRSVGPHLHYEVLYRGTPVNPTNYYKEDIDPKDYASIVKPIPSLTK